MTYSLDLDSDIIHLMPQLENIRKDVDDGNIGCGVYVDLQMISLNPICLIAISIYL